MFRITITHHMIADRSCMQHCRFPEMGGKTTVEERSRSGIGVWPGITADVNPPNATLRLYGGAAFERVLHEFRCAAYSIECPSVSREKVIYFS